MVKIEAIIQSSKVADVKAALRDMAIAGVSTSEVLIEGGPGLQKLFYRGAEYIAEVPMVKLEVLVSSFRSDEVVEAISQAARTGLSWEDGTILTFEVADAISIRTGERVAFALS